MARTKEQDQAAYRGLSPAKVAARLGCSEQHVLDLIAEEELRAIDVSRKGASKPRWSILPGDFDAFIHARQNRSEAA